MTVGWCGVALGGGCVVCLKTGVIHMWLRRAVPALSLAAAASLPAVLAQREPSEAPPSPPPPHLLPRTDMGVGDRVYQVGVLVALGSLSKFIMQILNHTTFVDTHKLVGLLDDGRRQRVCWPHTRGMPTCSRCCRLPPRARSRACCVPIRCCVRAVRLLVVCEWMGGSL